MIYFVYWWLTAKIQTIFLLLKPGRHLPVQRQQWRRHQKNVWNLFKVSNKDNIINFEKICTSKDLYWVASKIPTVLNKNKNYLKSFETTWNHLKPVGHTWNHLKPLNESTWNHTFLKTKEPDGAPKRIWKSSVPYSLIYH